MRRTKAQAQETRERLMQAALDVFHQRGVARASLHEIAQAAGVTRGALYWHFKNKEDLFDALFARIFDVVSNQLEADIRNAADMLQSLRQAFLNSFERLERDEAYRKFSSVLHLKCEHTEKNAAIVAVMTRYFDMWQQNIHTALQMCVAQKRLPADLDVALASIHLKSTLLGLTQLWLFRPHALQLSQVAPVMVDAALGGLQNCPALRLSHAQNPQAHETPNHAHHLQPAGLLVRHG